MKNPSKSTEHRCCFPGPTTESILPALLAYYRQEKNKSISDKQRGNGTETSEDRKRNRECELCVGGEARGRNSSTGGERTFQHMASAPISRPQRLGVRGWGGNARASQTSHHTDAFFFPNYLLFLLVLPSPKRGEKKRSRYIDKDVLQAST